MIHIDAKADLAEVKAGFEAMGYSIPNIAKSMMSAIASAARDAVRMNMGRYLKTGHQVISKDGKLKYKYLRRMALENRIYRYWRGDHYVVAAPMKIGEPNEKGATIRPLGAKALAFWGNDRNFHREKSVTIPPRRFFSKSLYGFEHSLDYNAAIAKAENKMVKAYEVAKLIEPEIVGRDGTA